MPPRVFTSYAHDSDEHKDQVREFATFLRGQGIEAVLDAWSAESRQDWYTWAIREMTDADYIIVVASRKYRQSGDGLGPDAENKGIQSEAALLRDLVHGSRATWLPKILPVVLPGHGIDEIPLFLQPNTADHYVVTALTVPGANELLRAILGRPKHVAPPVAGQHPELPILSGGARAADDSAGTVRWTTLAAPVDVRWRADLFDDEPRVETIELHLVPGDGGRCSSHRIRELRAELADLGRQQGIFAAAEPLEVDSTKALAWARSGDGGLAVHRSGQRSSWFPLTRRGPAGEPDEDHIAGQLTIRIRLLIDVNLYRPGRWVPAVGVEPGPRTPADQSVSDHDLRAGPAEVAKELTEAIGAALREARRAALITPADDQGSFSNNISGSAKIGKLIQARDIHGGIQF